MTVRQAFHEYVDRHLDDDELELWLEWLRQREGGDSPSLSPEERESVERALTQLDAGDSISQDELERRLRARGWDI